MSKKLANELQEFVKEMQALEGKSEKEITRYYFVRAFRRAWWAMVLCALAGAGLWILLVPLFGELWATVATCALIASAETILILQFG